MVKFLETIKIENKKICNINYHIERANRTIKDNENCEIDFEKVIFEILSKIDINSFDEYTYKLRIVYWIKNSLENPQINDIKINYEYSISKYNIPLINSLKIIEYDRYFYNYKYFDRSILDTLFKQRENCDDIIICIDGNVTDSYFANIVFENQYGLFTNKNPLLKGTKRQYYLDNNIIKETSISISEIRNFKKIHLINAMIDIGQLVIDINKII